MMPDQDPHEACIRLHKMPSLQTDESIFCPASTRSCQQSRVRCLQQNVQGGH